MSTFKKHSQQQSKMQLNTTITLEDLQKLRILGEGTYGKCYLVQNRLINQLCVLKQIQIMGMSVEEQKEVMKEATILSGLDHPYIVKFMFLFKTDHYLNIVMEYADGGDLSKVIREAKGNHFQQNQILNWFTQICLAIKHIHDRKIIHRDLKCQNIFMTKEGLVKLGDFGIAKSLSKTLEKNKTVVGTPYYMSPQICENKDYSIKTDIWSLGVMLYEMCALKLPFESHSLAALALKISKGQYSPITANYSRDLKALIKSLLQNNPMKRPSIAKILQIPFIAKRVPQFLPKSLLTREFSFSEISSKVVIEKQNDQEVFEENFKDNRSDLEADKKSQVHSARSHNPASKPFKTPQSKNSQIITNKLKQFGSNSKSGKIEKDKKKKELLKRRQISQPNLMIKKYSKNEPTSILQVREEESQSSEDCGEDLLVTLNGLIKERHGERARLKYLQTSDALGLANEGFAGNGLVSLLWGLENLNITL